MHMEQGLCMRYNTFLLHTQNGQKTLKEEISTSVWSAKHSNAGPNIQNGYEKLVLYRVIPGTLSVP